MNKYIKKINEYEDSELLDLLGDLSSLGFEKSQGWIFQWESTTENSLVEFVIAGSPMEALEIYMKNGWFGADISSAISSGKKFQVLGDVFEYLIQQKLIYNADIMYGLDLLKEIKETKGYGYVTRNDPYEVVNMLKRFFDNGPEKYRREVRSRQTFTVL
jgi:hypothetical protein